MIYTDAYLFDLASNMFDRNCNSTEVVNHLVKACNITPSHASRITSMAFDPS